MSDKTAVYSKRCALAGAAFETGRRQATAFDHSAKRCEPVAIIGIGCRFPGQANSAESFWRLLCEGRDAISEIPENRWHLSAFYDADASRPGKMYVRWGGFVSGIDQFDAQFFGISPREAAVMDPQHRLLLETAWEALEDGGQPAERLAGSRTGVFVGISSHDYPDLQAQPSERKTKNPYMALGSTACIAANRISYAFDFRGPSLSVDTACSSSLVAVHLACQSLWSAEAELALAGGVNALVKPESFISFCNASMLSPDGRCKAFDARANGYVRSEGAGAVVLKPLSRALEDGDRIYALIRATAVNQDGRSNGITVPSQAAQAEMLRTACRQAGISPAAVSYVEAHGTGTAVGDPIEAAALGEVLGAGRPRHEPCLIGSVKTNLGHLEAGSGIAGLIKTALALRNGQIPANLHFQEPNPKIDFERLRLRVPRHIEPWAPSQKTRIAGVNSFGFGGTNAHVILEEAPALADSEPDPSPAEPRLTTLSARSPEALRAAAHQLDDWLEARRQGEPLVKHREVAQFLATRRSHHPHRLAVVAASLEQLQDSLRGFVNGDCPKHLFSGRTRPDDRQSLAFVFSGMGPQWWAMGRELYRTQAAFKDAFDRCDALLGSMAGWSLIEELSADESASRIQEAWLAQPAIFSMQVALAALWRSWGIEPDAIVGHSVGEVAAACVADALDLEDAVRVIYHRSRLQNRLRGTGAMLAVGLTIDELDPFLDGERARIAVAAINSPESLTLSGDAEVLERLQARLEGAQRFARPLAVDVPYHSPQMEVLREELLTSLADIRPRAPCVSLYSTVTGRPVAGAPLDAAYWWRNVREPVRFAEATAGLLDAAHELFLELGPHPVLAASIRESARHAGKTVEVFHSLRRQEAEQAALLAALGQLYVCGKHVDWRRVNPGRGRFLNLPSYPWQREGCWQESEESKQRRLGLANSSLDGLLGGLAHPLLGSPLNSAQDGVAWQAELDLQQEHRWLADHCLRGSPIFPAAAFLEMALAAARETLGPGACVLESVEFEKPLLLAPEQPQTVQLIAQPGQGEFQVLSRDAGGGWVRHARGTLRRTRCTPASDASLAELRGRCADELSAGAWYDEFHAAGLEYGPTFRGVVQVWRGEREALGRVSAAAAVPSSTSDEYLAHPALLDACFQVLRAVFFDSGELWLPRKIERFRLLRRLAEAASGDLWCRAGLREQSETTVTVDLAVCDDDGQLLLEVEALQCQLLPDARTHRHTAHDCYEPQWEAMPLGDAPAIPSPRAPTAWLVFANAGDFESRLASCLRRCGEAALVVRCGDEFQRLGDDCWQVNPARPDHLKRLLDETPNFRGVLYLWPLAVTGGEALTLAELDAATQLTCVGLMHLLQVLVGAQRPGGSPRLWVATRQAQAAGAAERLAVAQSPLWGLARVVQTEHPEHRCTLVDLPSELCEGDVQAFLDEIDHDGLELEVALRAEGRYVQRLRQVSPSDRTPPTGGGPAEPRPFRLQVQTPGLLESLTAVPLSRTAPGPGQVEIEVQAAGVNFKDVAKAMNLLGEGSLAGTWSGRRLGLECAGRISAVGEGVTEFREGDAVVACAAGSFATHVLAHCDCVIHQPRELSCEQSASLPVALMTAYYSLVRLAHLAPGETVLIHAAAGGVGLAAVQLARHLGARVIATAGAPEKRSFLHEMGVDCVFDSRSLDFFEQVRRATDGRGVDVVLNSLSGDAISYSLALLAAGGRFVELGKRDIEQNQKLGLRPFQNNLAYFALDMDRLWAQRPAEMAACFRECMRLAESGALRPLPHRAFPVDRASAALDHMARARHIGKIVLDWRHPRLETPCAPEPWSFRADGTYLLAGGLGGFGLAAARWMVSRGARNLAIVGRRGAGDDAARQAIRGLVEAGARVRVASADVTREEDLRRVLSEVRRDCPPLRGVLHAAMVLDDGYLLQLDETRMRRVMAPKVLGAWNLHQQTLDDPLDCFILFSSVSATLGNPGQANYAAANAFLDALAHHRRALGLPALSVNWTAVADAGHVARNRDIGAHLARLGVQPLPADRLLNDLGELLQHGATQAAVMRMDWNKWGQFVPGGCPPRLRDLASASEATDDAAREAHPTRAAVLAAPAEQRRDLVCSLLREEAGATLGIEAIRIETDQPLTSLGLDSLMAVELSTRIKRQLGIELPVVRLIGGASVTSLANELIADIGAGAAAANSCKSAAAPGADGEKGALEVDWAAELQLDEAIRPRWEKKPEPAATALLTGPTGFLGCYLLHDLLERTDLKVVCLTRAENIERARARLRRNLERYELWKDAFAERILPLAGDLAEPGLGLSVREWERLAEQIDVIFHNGAWLSLAEPYASLRATNVGGTREILRLACHKRTLPVHYISSLGVFDLPATGSRFVITEEDVPLDLNRLQYGYTQSKAVAERLVREAGRRGLPVAIYRPGLINACSKTGAYTRDDFAAQLIINWVRGGAAADLGGELLLTPVDYVSRGVAHLSQQASSIGRTFHLVSSAPVRSVDLVRWIDAAGYPIELLSYNAWRSRLAAQEAAGKSEGRKLLSLLPSAETSREALPVWPRRGAEFQSHNTSQILAAAGIACPAINATAMERCLRYFQRHGVLPPPAARVAVKSSPSPTRCAP